MAPSREGRGPHLDAPVEEALTEHAEGDAPAVQHAGSGPQCHVRGCVVDAVVTHVLFQSREVVLQVVTHHQLAFQELQDLSRKTHTPHVSPRSPGWVWGNWVPS